MAYQGPTTHLLTFFSSLGLNCPERFNVADFALEQGKGGGGGGGERKGVVVVVVVRGRGGVLFVG